VKDSSIYRKPATETVRLALPTREAAAAIGVSVSTLERLKKAGEIAFVRSGRRLITYEIAELEAYLARSRRTVTGEGAAS